uniref:Ig-like domain-containing protein n=1 Tax=Periophthalmus magnuspinnatus TaxID=409849 RepID=A0A3B4A122_9GOBI
MTPNRIFKSFFFLEVCYYAFGQMSGCCTYTDSEQTTFEYEIRYTYNKNLLMQYNSTQGNWKGFTEFGVDRARMYNVDPEDAKLRKIEQMIFINIFVLESMYAAPSLKLSTVKQSSHTEPALLLCSAYNFYPQEIQMTWLLNGQEVTSAVTSTDILYNGNLYYQIHSYLEHRPKPGEEFSCMVEHVTLRDPLLKIWELHPPLPWSERVKIAVGTFFLAVGLTALITGFIKHKKVTAVLCTVMQGKHVKKILKDLPL